ALTGMATAYRTLSQNQQAINAYDQLLPLLKETKDRRGEYNALLGLGTSYRNLANNDRAINFLEQALVLAPEFGEKTTTELLINSLASITFTARQFAKAAEYSEKLSDIRRENKDLPGEASALLLAAACAREAANRSKAVEYYSRSLELYHRLN